MNRLNLTDLIGLASRMPGALRRRLAERRHRKLMHAAPRFALAEMPENTFGKLVGLARPADGRLLEAPLSGRLCVYYEVSIDAMANRTMLRTLVTEQEGIPFVLADGDSRAFVDPAHAVMSTGIDHVTSSTLRLRTPREEALLARHRLLEFSHPLADGLRYRESILEADERIAVFGGGVREPDPEESAASYRGAPPTRLCITGTSRFPLFISDDPRSVED